jgi:transcriptional regulator with XRE-family HTH domain
VKTVEEMINKMLEEMRVKDLAEKLRVSRSTVYRWRKGITRPSDKNYRKLENYFNKYFNFDLIVIYGIVRGIRDHDRYKPLEISFCIPHGSFSSKDINEIINDVSIAHGSGYIAVNPYAGSYDVVGINEEWDRKCDPVLRNYREIYDYIDNYLSEQEERKYFEHKYTRLDSEWND